MTKIVVNSAMKDLAEKIARKINRREFPSRVRTVVDFMECLRNAGLLVKQTGQLLDRSAIFDDVIGNIRLMHAHVSIENNPQSDEYQINVYPVIHIHYPGRVNYQLALMNTHLSSFAVALDVFELQKGNVDFVSVVKRLDDCSIPFKVRECYYVKEWSASDYCPEMVYGRLITSHHENIWSSSLFVHTVSGRWFELISQAHFLPEIRTVAFASDNR